VRNKLGGSMSNAKLLSLIILVVIAPQAFAAENKPLDLIYDANNIDEPVRAKAMECTLQIAPAMDNRNNKETFGSLGLIPGSSNPILSGNVTSWLDSGLQNLTLWGHTIAANKLTDVNKRFSLQPKLLYSYLWYGSSRIYATVVMSVDFKLPSGEIQTREYRELGSKAIWANIDSENVATFNYALNRVLWKIDQDARSLCAKL